MLSGATLVVSYALIFPSKVTTFHVSIYLFPHQVYAELTSRMVMTMEWVEGARLSDRPMLDKYGLEPSRLVDTMVR